MSDLVEKVAQSLFDDAFKNNKRDVHSQARAAIAAVAEWSMSNYYPDTTIERFWRSALTELEQPK